MLGRGACDPTRPEPPSCQSWIYGRRLIDQKRNNHAESEQTWMGSPAELLNGKPTIQSKKLEMTLLRQAESSEAGGPFAYVRRWCSC